MTRHLLQVQDLTVAFHGRTVVEGLSFDVAPGEIVALVGESGSGKTITARSIIGLAPTGAHVPAGAAVFDDRDLLGCPPAELRRVRGQGIGMIFQEPMTSLDPSMMIGEQLLEGLREHAVGSEAARPDLCVEMLARVGLGDPEAILTRYPHEFSGGMRQRISIAAAMLMRPKLLIADEPTTALDVVVQKEVLDLIVSLTREAATGVLLITHDLGLVAEYAHRTVVMRHGRLIEAGLTRDLLADPREAYTRALLEAFPRRGPAAVGGACREVLVDVEGLQVRMKGPRPAPLAARREIRAVDGVSLHVRRGEVLAIVGGSGSGKTTLARALLGLVPTAGGRIRFDAREIAGASAAALGECRKRMRIVFQDPYSALDPRMRIAEIVAEGLRHERGLAAQDRRRRVDRILEEVGLGGEFGRRLPHQLSGGQRQRVNIARALVAEPELVIADEPVSALDVTVQAEILSLLKRLQADRGFACIFISHALSVVEQIADRVVVLHRGRVVEEGTRDQVFDDPRHPYTCALLRAAPRLQLDGARGYRLVPYVADPAPPPAGFAYAAWPPAPVTHHSPPRLVEVSKDHRVACLEAASEGDPS